MSNAATADGRAMLYPFHPWSEELRMRHLIIEEESTLRSIRTYNILQKINQLRYSPVGTGSQLLAFIQGSISERRARGAAGLMGILPPAAVMGDGGPDVMGVAKDTNKKHNCAKDRDSMACLMTRDPLFAGFFIGTEMEMHMLLEEKVRARKEKKKKGKTETGDDNDDDDQGNNSRKWQNTVGMKLSLFLEENETRDDIEAVEEQWFMKLKCSIENNIGYKIWKLMRREKEDRTALIGVIADEYSLELMGFNNELEGIPTFRYNDIDLNGYANTSYLRIAS